MKRVLFFVCFLLVLTLSPLTVIWSQPTNTPADAAISGTQTLPPATGKVPIQLYRGYLVIVEGSIGKVQKLSFLVEHGGLPPISEIAAYMGATSDRHEASN